MDVGWGERERNPDIRPIITIRRAGGRTASEMREDRMEEGGWGKKGGAKTILLHLKLLPPLPISLLRRYLSLGSRVKEDWAGE